MREFSVAPLYEVPAGADLTDIVHRNAGEAPAKAVLGRKVDGVWRDVTAGEFLDEVTAVARGLVALGVGAGDRVAIMSRTRYEWSLLDFAVFEAGGVVVPIYETSSAEQVAWILADSGAVAAFTETAQNTALVESVRAQAADLKHVWQIDSSTDIPSGALALLAAAGTDVPAATLAQRRGTLGPDSVATIIYTSGTTGRPKGCVLSHGNMLFEACNAVAFLDKLFHGEGEHPEPSTLLFLPMAHVFARIIHIGAIHAQAKLGHCSDVKNVVEELGSFKPTFILSVPRVFEKVYNSASLKAHSEGTGKGKIFDAAAQTAIAWSEAHEAGKVPFALNLKHAVFDRLVYGKLRAALGGRTTAAISGGAPLGARLTHFFRGAGLFVCEGYGLTETAPAVAVNPYPNAKAGTVGPPLPGTTIRIAEDGEIEIKGEQVFRGYWNNEEATREVFTADGYFKTGDLGRLDDDGYLSITGRKKEILVTAGGKNVAPAVLEDRLNAHPLISQTMVVGDKQPFIAALVTLDAEALPDWLGLHGRDKDTPLEQLAGDPAVLQEIEEAVASANQAVSKAESIRKFVVLPTEWTIEGGQITPSMKIKRNVIAHECAGEIDKLYAK
ncbi:long-chain fatty acid--CoA ligase [Actinocrinis puniceicyclus]|uniref:Acyl-CoA synthetase n=1 Tax=Actinocrinis puniceicyclus TaxID=977794 RepID=A0A8J7WLK4_9ACTN|nr:long-chain fatty acid--CoA ligase [Actinocrinis puniceicyclus]MBS2964606.1 long-chain fatty acid--CoA ligase [Actinocrinis puniceicyclus]